MWETSIKYEKEIWSIKTANKYYSCEDAFLAQYPKQESYCSFQHNESKFPIYKSE